MTMSRTRQLGALFLALAVSCLWGCGEERPGEAVPPATVRMSAIPDFNKGPLLETNRRLAAFLSSRVGVEVRFEPVNDYQASVVQMAAGNLDLVWFGGVTACEAERLTGGDVTFVACRDIDLHFKSYFIAGKSLFDSGRIRVMQDLAELKPLARDLTFTFGSKMSTSGDIMPRSFLVAAGIDPEKDFAQPASHRPSGGHAATLASVASGAVDLGALNYSYYEKADAESKSKAPVFYETPEYVDYCFVAHNRLGPELIAKLRDALTSLDPARPAEATILEDWGAGRFVAADSAQWDGIRSVLKSLPKQFLK
ncbi:MAG: hypothetical protein Fur0037_09070 [Planctomycetota bacterium]